MGSLARVQERELRAWLHGRSAAASDLPSAGIDEPAGRMERQHHTPVESVVVGDAPLDERLRALLHAAGEAP